MQRVSDRAHAACNETGDSTCTDKICRAALRTAAMMTAKGTIAMMGMERRHSSHSSPITILFQCELGESPRLIAESSTIAANGTAGEIDEVLRSPPGRASRVR